jgi:hypothetical protein
VGPKPQRRRIVSPAKPRDDRPVYVRFVCFHTVKGQRTRLGLFQAIELARTSDQSTGWALAMVEDLNDWFSEHLAVPTRFERGSWRRSGQPALSWFKPEAVEHIRRMHELKTALEECGVHIEVLSTRTPGVVLYQDEHQLTAEPGAGRF